MSTTPARPVFKGYPDYLDAAVAAHEASPASADDARRQPALSHVASLVAAVSGSAAPSADTLRRARELVDGLKLAHHAAEAMLATVTPETEVETETEKEEDDRHEQAARDEAEAGPGRDDGEGQTDRPARRPDRRRRQ